MKKLALASLLMTASVFLSRIIGYIRDAIIAAKFGASGETDTYFAAFTLPDFLNYLVAGGAFSLTFIPIFTKFLVNNEEEKGWKIYSIIISVMTTVMILLIIALEIFMPQIVPHLFPGFSQEAIDKTVLYTRIVLPAQLFFYNGGILSAVLMAKKRFVAPALSPLIYNISIIVFGLLFSPFGMIGFAIGATVGAVLGPFLLQYLVIRKEIIFKINFDFKDKDFLKFLKISIPIMIGLILVTLDDYLSKMYGSYLDKGTISWLNNSRRLVLVPIGLFAQANGQAILPFLSEYFAKKDFEGFNNLIKKSLSLVFFVSSFAASWFFVFNYEIIKIVYERGAFNQTDTIFTSLIFMFLSISIPFWSGILIVSKFYYAMEKTVLPMLIGSVMTFISLPLFNFLAKKYQVFGLSITITIIKILYFIVIFSVFKKVYGNFKIKEIFIELFKIVLFFAITSLGFFYLKSKLNINWFLMFSIGTFVQITFVIFVAKYLNIESYNEFVTKYLNRILKKLKLKKS